MFPLVGYKTTNLKYINALIYCMNTRILEEIGLTKGEIKAYLALLKIGSCSTGPLAKESQVSRSKLYSILDKLEKKGLVSHIEKNGVVYFQAVEPAKIKDYLQQKEDNLKTLEKEFEQFLPTLNAFKESQPKQQVTLYQGFKGLKTAHEHNYLKLKKGDEYYYLGVPAYQPEEHHTYWKKDHLRRIKAGIKCKALFNQDTKKEIIDNRNSFKGCEARYMPGSIKTPAEIMIYKDTVMIAIARKDTIAIEIVNQDIADSFKEYFDAFWNQQTTVYSGIKGIELIFEDMLNYKDNWFIGGNCGVEKYMDGFWKQWNKRRVAKKVFWHDLLDHGTAFSTYNYSAKERERLKKEEFYEYRVLPKELASPHVFFIYGDKVANVLWNKTPAAFVIENKEIAESYKKYFDYIWKSIRRP